jgi:hypothetical protein
VKRPVSLDTVAAEEQSSTRQESSVVADVAARELLALIDTELEVDLRATYLQMREGKAVPSHRREAVEEAVREIVADALDQA